MVGTDMKKQKGTLTYRRVGPQPMVLEKWAFLIHGGAVHAGNKGGVLRSCLQTQGEWDPHSTCDVAVSSLNFELLLKVFSWRAVNTTFWFC